MALMEFLKKNQLNTTTMVNVNSAGSTALVQYLFDRNTKTKYQTTDYSINTTATIIITFSSPVVLSHILLRNHNLKQFQIYETTTTYFANETTNSATSSYYSFASTTVSTITLKLTESIAGSGEKQIGELILTERQLQFERNPSIQNFEPRIFRKQVRHEMPDGGISLFNIKDKYRANMNFGFITEIFHNSLLDIYNTAQPIIYCPFPTTTAWDGKAYEVVWSGDFGFKFGANNKESGYSGKITLEETVSG